MDPLLFNKVLPFLAKFNINYTKYFKYSFGIGSVIGTTLCIAGMLDRMDQKDQNNQKYKFSRVEMISYPLIGVIGGGAIGVTFPVWMFFFPLGMVLGSDLGGALLKTGLLFAMNLPDEEKEKKDEKKD